MHDQFFTGKNILLISPEDWTHLFVSKHHYAIELANRGNKVFFLNPPGNEMSCRETRYQNIFELHYKGFVPGLRFMPEGIQRWALKKEFNQLQKLARVSFDCVWSFDNSVFFDFSFLPPHILTLCHIVDHSQNFQFQRAAASAKICFGVSQNIVDRLLKCNEQSFLVPHGIAADLTRHIPVQLPGINKLKALYAGNLKSKYLDTDLLATLVRQFPHIDFIMYGPGGEILERFPNLYCPGVIDREVLPSYLEAADVLLLLYAFERFPEQLTNAHKILEYLQSGNVIVSNFVPDYQHTQDLLVMGDSNHDLVKKFEIVISHLAVYNSPEKKRIRKSHADANTYGHRLRDIEKIINRLSSQKKV